PARWRSSAGPRRCVRPPRWPAWTCPPRRGWPTGCAPPTCWRPARCSSSPIPSCGPPCTSRSRRASAPWPTPKRPGCWNATGPTPNASRCTCCAASRAPTRGWRRCCARPPPPPPGAAAACLRRALDEPPPAADRPGLLLELGIALARERSPAAVPVLREAVELAGPDAALLAARVLGIWAYHAEAAAICRDALGGPVPDDLADSLQAELFQNAVISAETVAEAVTLPRRTGRSAAWGVNDALQAATSADGGAITLPALDRISPDSMGAVYALLVLTWAGEFEAAGRICDTVLADARRRGSMSMVAHA